MSLDQGICIQWST